MNAAMETRPDTRTTIERKAFDPKKHYLGTLCIRKHDAGDGRSWRHLKHDNCVECSREGARRWRHENLERARQNTKRRDDARPPKPNALRRRRWPFALAISSVRASAKNKGLPFNLTVDFLKTLWIAQAGECFWTGQSIDFVKGRDRDPFRPSIDKLVPSEGYVQGNVVWASNFANRARSDCPANDFAEIMIRLGFAGAFLVDERVR